jgi:hypothetical protein
VLRIVRVPADRSAPRSTIQAKPIIPARSDKERPVSDETKVCPVCAETIKAAATKCRFCNSDLAAIESAREAEVERELFVGRPKPITSVGQWALVAVTVGIAYLIY